MRGMIFVTLVTRTTTHFPMKTTLISPAFYIIIFCTIFTSCSSSKNQQRTPKNDVADQAALQNKRWVLTKLPDTSFKEPAKDIYIQFQSNNLRMNGFAGCNSYSGVYTIGAKSIAFSSVISTKMYCDNMPLENRMMRILSDANAYLITGETLQLLRDDKPLAWFSATYLK